MLPVPIKNYSIKGINNLGLKRIYTVKAKSLPKALKKLYKLKGKIKIDSVEIDNKSVDHIYLGRMIEKVEIWHEKNKHTLN